MQQSKWELELYDNGHRISYYTVQTFMVYEGVLIFKLDTPNKEQVFWRGSFLAKEVVYDPDVKSEEELPF